MSWEHDRRSVVNLAPGKAVEVKDSAGNAAASYMFDHYFLTRRIVFEVEEPALSRVERNVIERFFMFLWTKNVSISADRVSPRDLQNILDDFGDLEGRQFGLEVGVARRTSLPSGTDEIDFPVVAHVAGDGKVKEGLSEEAVSAVYLTLFAEEAGYGITVFRDSTHTFLIGDSLETMVYDGRIIVCFFD